MTPIPDPATRNYPYAHAYSASGSTSHFTLLVAMFVLGMALSATLA